MMDSFDTKNQYVLGIGGANMDLHAALACSLHLHDSNPGIISSCVGGVTRNILDNLARQNVNCKMLTSVGRDAFGDTILGQCRALGIDMSHVLVRDDYPTGTYVAIMDAGGDMVVASCDTRIIENIPLSYFDENKGLIEKASAIVCDPNLTAEQLIKIGSLTNDSKLFIDPTSGEKALRIKDILHLFYFIKPNRLELELLADMSCSTADDIIKASERLLDKGVHSVAVSLGKDGCYYADIDGNSIFRSFTKAVDVSDVTGAGDAFMAGMLSGYFANLSIDERLNYAMAFGGLTVMSDDTISSDINPENIDRFIKEYIKQ